MRITAQDIRELNLFTYSKNKDSDTYIDEVSDHDDWKEVRNTMLKNTGINSIPLIYVSDFDKKKKTLELKHEHDGRDLELNYAEQVIKSIKHIWDGEVKLFTIVEEEMWEI